MSDSYLQNLTLLLAEGAARLDEPLRRRHTQFLLGCQAADGGFPGRDGPSDLYYTAFGLRGLAVLGQLDGLPARRAAGYLQSRLAGHVPLVDVLSLIYAASLLELAAGIAVFEGALPNWRAALAQELERFRRPDGGYAKSDQGEMSSLYHTFLVVLCYQLLEQPLAGASQLAAFVASRRRDDGGFVEFAPMRTSGTNPTAAGVALLRLLNACDEETRAAAGDFLAAMQTEEGGFRANGQIPLADLLSTFTALASLADLELLHLADLPAAAAYVRALEQPGGGFSAGTWDPGVDVEYTFYGLGSLALLETADGRTGR
ncbi:MAG: terpene cyclase/mutase family protein [Pirellulales bacterium]|nr:terpene cyclase/mutase family protein [Pirellulales bacterium]